MWIPSPETVQQTNLFRLIQELSFSSYKELYEWSVNNREVFWKKMIEVIGIRFQKPYHHMLDLSHGIEDPHWLVDATLNIAESCFQADPKKTAILFEEEQGSLQTITYGKLNGLSNTVAESLLALGFKKGNRIAIDMPMTVDAVSIYLGIVKAGMCVVSIADSFAPEEIKTRLRIAEAKAIFTQDVLVRSGKKMPLYQKIIDADAPMAIVISAEKNLSLPLRKGDISWSNFKTSFSGSLRRPSSAPTGAREGQADRSAQSGFELVACHPDDETNILFSSGTTGEPKAIPWTHTTPIKCAVDGYLHQDIQPHDVVAWPTNLGWMMGPWLIYATLINKGTIALFYGSPTTHEFCEFVQNARVTMLGVVPSIVKAWREHGSTEGVQWNSIKCFSSTGECSNADDYAWLMSLAGNKPVIEYCGGTEIGGGYLTGTLLQPALPTTFTTPALGLDFVILDEQGKPTTNGEVFLLPPSIGLSTRLLNRDHHAVYFAETPQGRRHGDQIEKLPNGYYRAHGRADDTMNLGGIKVSSAEIERVLNQVEEIHETAAIAVSPEGGGPSNLVIYVVLKSREKLKKKSLQEKMQQTIKQELNPLFKIHDIVIIDALPRTASNKIMRRMLRLR